MDSIVYVMVQIQMIENLENYIFHKSGIFLKFFLLERNASFFSKVKSYRKLNFTYKYLAPRLHIFKNIFENPFLRSFPPPKN